MTNNTIKNTDVLRSNTKTRPHRIYKRKGLHKKYIKKDGKRTYIKVKNGNKITNKQLVNVIVKNVIGHKRITGSKNRICKTFSIYSTNQS